MADLSLLPPNPSSLHLSSPHSFRPHTHLTLPRRFAGLSPLPPRRCSSVIRASNTQANNIVNSDAGSAPFFNFEIPIWVTWFGAALTLFSIPFYRRIRNVGDELEVRAEEVVEAVENVAEAAERVSSAVKESLPEGKLKDVALKVEKLADDVDQKAERAEELLGKIDETEGKLDALVEEEGKTEEQEAKKTA